MIGLVDSDCFLGHEPDSYHPEQPERLSAIRQALKQSGAMASLQPIAVRAATDEELARIHLPAYVEQVAALLGRGSGHLDPDTYYSPGSLAAARAAAGSTIDLLRATIRGEVDGGLALVRPPGHHATPARAMGFCIFNNIAVAAADALASGAAERLLIVDWDVHHGNGTQEAFYADPRVHYFSTHRYPFYPGTGSLGETGTGEGVGATMNVPLPASCGDAEYLSAFEQALVPWAARFQPDAILVSAGFDSFVNDPLGGMAVSAEGFARLTRCVRSLLPPERRGRVVFVLEGGYDLRGLGKCVNAVVDVVSGKAAAEPGRPEKGPRHSIVRDILEEVRRIHAGQLG